MRGTLKERKESLEFLSWGKVPFESQRLGVSKAPLDGGTNGNELESPVPISGAQVLAVSVTPSVWLPGKGCCLEGKETELPSGVSGLWQGWNGQQVQGHSSF